MKRIVFALVLVLGVVSLNAANPVRLVKGDVSVFQQEVVANVIIDDHTTKIDRTNQTADVYYGNKSQAEYDKFVDDVDRGHASFITYFNEKKISKTKLTMASQSEYAQYTLKVDVSLMNVGNGGGVVWIFNRKSGGALINGTMHLIDNATGEEVCTFEFERVKGLMGPIFRARVISVYRYLADGLLDAIQ